MRDKYGNIIEFAEAPKMRRGIYKTDTGHEAFVNGPGANIAWDKARKEHIPIEFVNAHKFVRPANSRRG